MKRACCSLFSLVCLAGLGAQVLAGEPSDRGKIILEDHFERDESIPDKDDIGNGWTSNSRWRAKGNKQVDLVDGAMHVTRHPVADHGVAIFHDIAMKNGAVQLKFKLGEKDDLGVDFVDRELKTVHAGHLCMARVTLKQLRLMDSKTGHMDLKIRERRLAGEKSKELAEFLKTKSKVFPIDLKPNHWYTLLVEIDGNVMTASIDGKVIGKFESEGIGHPTKRMMTLAVNKSAWVDDVTVWRRDPKSE